MIKPQRNSEQQAFNPIGSRQTISDRRAEPEFQENHKRLRAERQAREKVDLELKVKK